MQMWKIYFLFFQEYFSSRSSTFAFKNYSSAFQTALLLLNVGVTNGLSKMLSLDKFKPSLVISALKKSVSESRISQKYDGLGVSDFENLDLGVSDFENLDLEISPMGKKVTEF